MTMSHTDQTATDAPPPEPGINLTIDGVAMTVPKGTLLIRAAEQLGVAIPRFCDHPLLDPVGACRQCIVDVEGQRKPLTACTTVVTEGMVVKTQLTSELAAKAQAGTMELLLINHPLDCPVCDKGGECPLQNQAMSAGRPASRFVETKRTYPKPLPISSEVLLDRERCVLCARCTRFSEQIAGDPFIDLFERGANQQVSVYRGEAPEELDPTAVSGGATGLDGVHQAELAEAPDDIADPFNSYFSGNTIQICPVGALTSAAYRFRARPFDLVSTPTVCEHCSSGCAQRTDWRRNRVLRRLAGEDPEVNEEWNCDKGRFAFAYPAVEGRITTPLVRNSAGRLVETSWSEALTIAAEGLREAREAAGVGVLTGGRLTVEDAFAYSLFARAVLGTNDIDFRARPHSAEEADFLAGYVAGSSPESGGVAYRALDVAPTVLLAGFEPEEESPIVFLRLRKAARAGKTKVYSIAPWATEGLRKLSGTLIPAIPGTEHLALDALTSGVSDARSNTGALLGSEKGPSVTASAENGAAAGLREPGAVILVGERLAETPGALVAALRLAATTGARLAWIPRRAGDRGAIAAGALPNLLPGGRPVTDTTARESLEELLDLSAGTIPTWPGRDTAGILAAASEGELDALVVAGVDIDDLADPAAAAEALNRVGFCLSLELRHSTVTAHADVVLPIAAVVEKAGTFLDWEGRERPFEQALRNTTALSDAQVLDALAAELDVTLGASDLETLRSRWRQTASAGNAHAADPAASVVPVVRPSPRSGEAVLSSWHHLLDSGALQVGEENLAGTAPAAVVRLSIATAAEIGASDGDRVTVSTEHGAITLPLVVTPMPDHVVWLPTKSPGSALRSTLRVTSGALVRLSTGVAEVSDSGADLGEVGAKIAAGTRTSGKSPQADARQSEEGGAA